VSSPVPRYPTSDPTRVYSPFGHVRGLGRSGNRACLLSALAMHPSPFAPLEGWDDVSHRRQQREQLLQGYSDVAHALRFGAVFPSMEALQSAVTRLSHFTVRHAPALPLSAASHDPAEKSTVLQVMLCWACLQGRACIQLRNRGVASALAGDLPLGRSDNGGTHSRHLLIGCTTSPFAPKPIARPSKRKASAEGVPPAWAGLGTGSAAAVDSPPDSVVGAGDQPRVQIRGCLLPAVAPAPPHAPSDAQDPGSSGESC